jgi:hypothetical protein
MTAVNRKHLSAFSQSVNMLLFHAQISCNFEQLAILVFGTGKTIAMMIGDNKFHSNAA